MDSPEPTAKTTVGASSSSAATATANTTSSSTSPVQESPFSNFISNLSPIGDVKAPHALQGFLGLNSPPLVFKSPHINALRETSFFKRSLCPQLPSAEASQNEDGGKKIADGPGDLQKSDFLLQGGLIADTHKDSDMKYSVQVQPSSSSGCVDEYLADPVEVDCANSTFAVPNLKQSSNAVQSSHTGITDSKKTMSKFDEKTDMKMKVAVPDTMPREAEQDIPGKSIFDIKPNSIEEDNTRGAWSSNECPNIKSNLSVEHVSCEDSDAQNAGSAHGDDCNYPSQYLPEQLQIIQTHEHSEENAGAIPCGLVDSTMHDPEASQNQRGMSRRCLQFEEARPKTTVNSTNPLNKANNGTSSRSPTTPAESEGLDSSYVNLSAISSKRQLVNLSQPVTPMFPHHTGKSTLTISKPSGIGLHLNSIVNALPKGHGGTVGVKLTSAEYGTLETKASIAVSSMISESFDNIGPLDILPPIDHHTTPHTKRKFNSEHTDSFEEFGQISPKKKRKKPSSTIDGDGCKRCNCKKTKCLKLYCDCFAAGIYCADPCACQGCFNRPEYEDTVLETRQQIESRNPLAFAPKIVQHGTELPVNHGDDRNRLTPSSARHKRGCNCKKSMCLKKYCECYQANVGCSSGCRCEGCKNVYGRKEDYVGTEDMVSNRFSKERSQGTFDDKLETVTNNKDFLHTELYDAHNLTPLTPSFQCSDHGKDAPKSRILCRRYIPSPDSDLTILSSYAKTLGSMKTSDSNDMILETSKEILDAGSCGQGMDYNREDMTEQLSSRCDALTDIRRITPLLDFPSMAIASSASFKAGDWTNVSRLQLCPQSGSLSSGGSLLWRSSPVTPMTQLGGTKNHQALDSDSRLCDILEDDTPEILKDASTPIKSVKVSSPSRKRVSPPHGRGHELGSNSSGALKSGRKFILKAVPSFPPLTPCIDSKGSTDQNKSDLQENK